MTATRPSTRLESVDVLRGLVVVIMALDHARDFLSSAQFDPTDLTQTTPLLFFTRWITHFCAPVFVLLAGTSAFLMASNGRSKAELSRLLLTRGLWLIALEIGFVSPAGWAFNFGYGFTRLQVIWVIGLSMVILAGFIRILPHAAIAVIGGLMILGHNALDGARADWLGPLVPTWRLLHQLMPIQLLPGKIVLSIYPLVPWLGVLMLGYGAGSLVLDDARRTRRFLLIGGLTTTAFVALRFSNVYGDPALWSVQSDPLFTVLSFLDVTKYPPSLLYLLMTLGPAFCVLAVADRLPSAVTRALLVFGRAPLFFYLLHLPLLHAVAVFLSTVQYGHAPWLFHDLMAKHGQTPLPLHYGYGLGAVYGIWALIILALYPLCRWYGGVKATRRFPILAYL